MRDIWGEINSLSDGTYLITSERVVNYAERWGYGYIIGARTLEYTDLKNGTLFDARTNSDGLMEYALVTHVDNLTYAKKLAADWGQRVIWDLREQKEVFV